MDVPLGSKISNTGATQSVSTCVSTLVDDRAKKAEIIIRFGERELPPKTNTRPWYLFFVNERGATLPTLPRLFGRSGVLPSRPLVGRSVLSNALNELGTQINSINNKRL